MNIFAGLEKFGLKVEEKNLYEEEKKPQAKGGTAAVQEDAPTEDSFLLEKAIRCPVCDKVFKTKMIKNGRTKRLEPDDDLRPRFEYIDTIKYDVASCPSCGYSAMNRYFEHLTAGQIKLVQESVCANYKPSAEGEKATYDYDTALDRYKLALFNTIVKRGKTSERAYTCLKIAWLYRGKAESLDKADPKYAEVFKECKEQEEAFYEQAYEGFTKAISKEMFPMCGMDQCTMDYLLAVMSVHFKKYDIASKCISNIQSAPSASKRMKDKAFDLKEKIVAQMKQGKA